MFLFYFIYSLTTPNYSDTGNGSIYFYPLYATFGLMCVHTMGTWLWVYTNIWVAIVVLNSKFGETAHKLLNQGSLWCYASHYLFIVLISYYIVRPMGMTFAQAFFTIFFGAEIGVMITWIGILQITAMLKTEKAPRQ